MLNWKDVTRDELIELYVHKGYSDQSVADFFGVTKSQATYKRKKYGLSQDIIVWKQLCLKEKDKKSWQETIEKMDTATISTSLAHYIFRDGPVEDMHSDGKLSETDMKTLNKYMNDRLATVIHLLKEHDWIRLISLIEMNGLVGSGWDAPNLCIEEIDRLSAQMHPIHRTKE